MLEDPAAQCEVVFVVDVDIDADDIYVSVGICVSVGVSVGGSVCFGSVCDSSNGSDGSN